MRGASLVLFLAVSLFFIWRLSAVEDEGAPMGDHVTESRDEQIGGLGPGSDDGEGLLGTKRTSALPIVSVLVKVVNDEPLPGARIFVSGEERAITNADGFAELRDMLGGQVIVVRAVGYLPGEVRLPPKQNVVEVALVRGMTISGLVHDGVSGSAIAGAKIRGERDDWEEAITDDQGRFGPLMLPARAISVLFVENSGYLTKRLAVEGVSDNQLLIALHRGHVVAGRVIDRKEDPISGARIGFRGTERSLTDEHGSFSVLAKASPGGELPLNFSAKGFVGIGLEVKPDTDKLVNPSAWVDEQMIVTMVHCAEIKGVVRNTDGSTMKSGEVSVLLDGARSKDAGRAYMKSLPSNASWLQPGVKKWPIQDGGFHVRRVLPWMSHTTLEILDDESGERTRKTIHRSLEPGSVHEVQWQLSSGKDGEQSEKKVHLSGMVMVNGVPVEKGFVGWRQRPEGEKGSFRVAKGKYSGKVPAGNVGLRIYVSDEQGREVSAGILRGEHLREAYIPVGAAHTENFDLELELGTITGRVEKSPAMQPLGNVPVFVNSDHFVWNGETDAYGEFELSAPLGAEYKVGVLVDGVTHGETKVRCGQQVNFIVGAALELCVKAKDKIGKPVACSVWWRKSGSTWWSPLRGDMPEETLRSEAIGKVAGGLIEICVVPQRGDLSAKFTSIETGEVVAGNVDLVLDPGWTLELDIQDKEWHTKKLFLLSEAEWKGMQVRRKNVGHAQARQWALAQQVIPHRLLERREIRVGPQGKAAVSGLAQGSYRVVSNTRFTAMEPIVDIVGPGVSRVTIW